MSNGQSYEEAYEECRQAAIAAGALKPQGLAERMAAGVLAYQRGQSWASTPTAQNRLAAWIEECVRRKSYSR